MSDTSPENGWGPLSFPEAASNLSLASRQLRVRGHCGRLIRQDQSRLSFPKHCGERQGAPDWSTLTGNASRHIGGEHLLCVQIKWCCQHGPGGVRGLGFQMTSSQLVRVRGRSNWRQGSSFGQARGTFVPHRFVGRWQGAGGQERILRFARIRIKARDDYIPTFFLDCGHREFPAGHE